MKYERRLLRRQYSTLRTKKCYHVRASGVRPYPIPSEDKNEREKRVKCEQKSYNREHEGGKDWGRDQGVEWIEGGQNAQLLVPAAAGRSTVHRMRRIRRWI